MRPFGPKGSQQVDEFVACLSSSGWQLPHLSDAEAHRLLPPEAMNSTGALRNDSARSEVKFDRSSEGHRFSVFPRTSMYRIYSYLERRMNTFFCAKAVFGQNLSYMDILINELGYLAVWTEKQYRTKAYPYETPTLSTFYRQKPKQLY